MAWLYEYTLHFEHADGRSEAVVIEAVDAGHAFSEASDDADIWPGDAMLVSIVRGERMPYGTDDEGM